MTFLANSTNTASSTSSTLQNGLDRANAAWITDSTTFPSSLGANPERPALPHRQGLALWVTTQGDRRKRQVGIVVSWRERGAVPLGDLEATLTSLTHELDADALLILTDHPGVYTGWASDSACLIRQASPRDLRNLAYPAGAMAPRIEAACRFVAQTGRRAVIGRLDQLEDLLAGTAGTQILVHTEPAFGPGIAA